ncbi:hypothetical protein ACW9UR_11525 [Halovulum sp. GXIMD14794]
MSESLILGAAVAAGALMLVPGVAALLIPVNPQVLGQYHRRFAVSVRLRRQWPLPAKLA